MYIMEYQKRMLLLYYCEYEYRFNHRKRRFIMNKIKDYITQFEVATKKMIHGFVDQYAMASGFEIFQVCQMGTYKIKNVLYDL